MQEKIGKVKIEDQFYKGERASADEQQEAARLEKLVSEYSKSEYNQIIAQEKNWAVLFSLSHIRENAVEWLPITGEQTVLELGSGYGALTGALAGKAKQVTCVETSMCASRVNALRNRDQDGVEILVGCYGDMEDTLGLYDWILMIGALEQAPLYRSAQGSGSSSESACLELLQSAKKHLAPGGKIVIASENRLGLKYFAGCQEEYGKGYFAGLEGYDGNGKEEGYPDRPGRRTFSGPELRRLAKRCDLECGCLYYPYPDYRLPMTIYSDQQLPRAGELWDNLRNFDRERYVLFDESKVFDQIIKDGLFPVFSNAFLMILEQERKPQEEELLFVKYSNERSRRFAIRTEILKDSDGNRKVRKSACYPEGKEHIEKLPVWEEKLEKVYRDTPISLNHCRSGEQGVEIEYLTGETLEERMDHLLLEGRTREVMELLMEYLEVVRRAGSSQIFYVTPEFEEVFGQVLLPPDLTCAPVTDIDMVAGNVILKENGWIHMDYEWTFDFPIPVNYVLYRIIQNYLYGNVERQSLYKEQLYKKAGLTEQELAQYEKMEEAFQNYITGDHQPLRVLYQEISPGCVDFHAEEAHRREVAAVNAAANQGIDIFVDTFEIAMTGIHVSGWAVSKADRQVQFELRDEKGEPLETVKTEYLYRRDVVDQFKLSGKNSRAGFHLECRLPVSGGNHRKFTLVARDGLTEAFFVIPVEKLRLKQSRLGKKVMALRGAKDVIQYIAPREMGVFGESRQYRVENQRFDTWRMANRLSEREKQRQRQEQTGMEPLITVLLPETDLPIRDYRRTIESLLHQTGKNVEVVLTAAEGGRLTAWLQKQYPANGQVRWSSKEALSHAKGAYILLMQPGDTLEEYAVYEFTKAIKEHPEAGMIYSDSDRVDWEKKEYFDPQFKPDDSRITLLSGNYIGNSILFQKSLLAGLGEIRREYGSQIVYDCILRCREKTGSMVHIQRILYHQSSPLERNLRQRQELCQEWEAGRRILRNFLEEHQIAATVEWANYPLRYRVNWAPAGNPLVSVVIPNQDHIHDLEQCLQSIFTKSTYKNLEVLVVENNSTQESTLAYYRGMQERYPGVRLLNWEREFNYSAINNFAVREARGEYLIFLNNDTEVLTPGWVEELLFLCQCPGAGVVGAKLYYPDGTIQHAGVILGLGTVAGHLFVKEPGKIPGYQGRACTIQNLSAVTAACMMTEKKLFEQVGGFDETLQVAFNDVDYCMKVTSAGRQVIFNPNAELYHYESKSRGLEDTPQKKERYDREVAYFCSKWGVVLEQGDPYYNPNLSRTTWNCTFRIPPK